MTLYCVKVLNNRTECFDIIGGIFNSKENVEKFIEENNITQYEIETVQLNQPNYITIG